MGRWALRLIFKKGQHKTDDSEAQSDHPDEQMAHFTRPMLADAVAWARQRRFLSSGKKDQ